jgi:CRP-like cAMP-binding protein
LYQDDISKINMFNSIESAFVIEIITNSRPFQTFENENIFNEGDVCNEFIFVKDGNVRILSSAGHKNIVIGCVTEGDYFGDAEFLKNTTAVATYQSVTTCHMLSVPHGVMSRAMAASSSITATQLNRWFEQRYANISSLLRSKGMKKPQDKNRPSLKQSKSILFGLSSKSSKGRSFFGVSTGNSNRVDDSDDERVENAAGSPAKRGLRARPMLVRQASKSEAKFKLDTISRNLWINGEIKDSSTSMAFLSIDDQMPKHIQKIRVVVINREGEPEAVEKPINILAENFLCNPMGIKKIQWDFFVGILILYSVLVVPVEIAFSGDAFSGSNIVNLVINGFFFIDIILSFMTAMHWEALDALIIDKPTIIISYARTWFLIDVVSTIPFDEIVSAATETSGNLSFTKLVKVIRLLRLLKLARILKLGSYIEKIEDALGISPIIFSLLSLLIQVFFIAHWACCLWWGITSFASDLPWFTNYASEGQGLGFFPLNLRDGSMKARYLMTLYYILTTMTTVGYGDIRPTTMAERAMGIVLALCGASLFGYMIANVSGLLSSLGGANSSAKEHLSEVSEYLKEKNCPTALQDKIKNHYKRQVKENSAYDVEKIVGRLPSMISNDILFYLNEKRMQKIKFFHYIQNKSVAVYLLQKLSPIFCDEGHYLFREGEYCKEISFIVSGEAHAFRQQVVKRSKPVFVRKADFNESDLWQRVMDMQMDDAEAEYDMGLEANEDNDEKGLVDSPVPMGPGHRPPLERAKCNSGMIVIPRRSSDGYEHDDECEEGRNDIDDDEEEDFSMPKMSSPAVKYFPAGLQLPDDCGRSLSSPNCNHSAARHVAQFAIPPPLVNPLSLRGSYRHGGVSSPFKAPTKVSELRVSTLELGEARPQLSCNPDITGAATASTNRTMANELSPLPGKTPTMHRLSMIFGEIEDAEERKVVELSSQTDDAIAVAAATTTNADGETSTTINNFKFTIGMEAWEWKYLKMLEEKERQQAENDHPVKKPEESPPPTMLTDVQSKKSLHLDSISNEEAGGSSSKAVSRAPSEMATGSTPSPPTTTSIPHPFGEFPTQFPSSRPPASSSVPHRHTGFLAATLGTRMPRPRSIDSMSSMPSDLEGSGEMVSQGKSFFSRFFGAKKRGIPTTASDVASTTSSGGVHALREYNPLDNISTVIRPPVTQRRFFPRLSITTPVTTPKPPGSTTSNPRGSFFPVRRGSNASVDNMSETNSNAGFAIGKPMKKQRRMSTQQASFLPIKESLSFIVQSREEAPVDIFDEYARKKRKPLLLLTANDYDQLGYQFLGKLEVGDFVGHSAFLRHDADEQHHCSVRTVHPTTAYVISKQDITKLLRIEPTVAIQFQAALKEAVMEQATIKGKTHLQGERAVFLRNLRRRYQVVRSKSSRKMTLRRLSAAIGTSPRLPPTPYQFDQHQHSEYSRRAKTPPPPPSRANEDGQDSNDAQQRAGPRFTLWEVRDPEFLSYRAQTPQNGGASRSLFPFYRGNNNNNVGGGGRPPSVASGYESSGGDSQRGAAASIKKTKKRIHKLFKRNRIYYDSDDSREDAKRKQRQQMEQVGRFSRVLLRLQNTFMRFSKRLNLDGANHSKSIQAPKRCVSMSALDYTYIADKGSFDHLFHTNVSNTNGRANEGSNHTNTNTNTNGNQSNNGSGQNSPSVPTLAMRRRTFYSGARRMQPPVPPRPLSVHMLTTEAALDASLGLGTDSSRVGHGNNNHNHNHATVGIKLMRRQSFPSWENEEWKRSKLQDYLI